MDNNELYAHFDHSTDDITYIGPKRMSYKWDRKTAVIPHKCSETGKWIWPGQTFFEGSYAEWADNGWIKHVYTSITPKAYTALKLTGTDKNGFKI